MPNKKAPKIEPGRDDLSRFVTLNALGQSSGLGENYVRAWAAKKILRSKTVDGRRYSTGEWLLTAIAAELKKGRRLKPEARQYLMKHEGKVRPLGSIIESAVESLDDASPAIRPDRHGPDESALVDKWLNELDRSYLTMRAAVERSRLEGRHHRARTALKGNRAIHDFERHFERYVREHQTYWQVAAATAAAYIIFLSAIALAPFWTERLIIEVSRLFYSESFTRARIAVLPPLPKPPFLDEDLGRYVREYSWHYRNSDPTGRTVYEVAPESVLDRGEVAGWEAEYSE